MLVGRDNELAAVERLLDRSTAGAGALLLVGEPGIGKTTVWRAGVDAATARGFTVLRAQPGESERKLSYTTLTDLAGGVYEQVREALPAPQQRGLDAALLRVEAAVPADPRAIATGLLSVLTLLAERAPALVAVDDVQWVDPASERALAFVARRLPERVGLLLTRRTAAGDAGAVESALAAEQLERVTLAPLSLAALHHLLRESLAEPPPRPLLIRIGKTSGGNPFFALELARTLSEAGTKLGPAAQLPLPERLHDLVPARLAGLSKHARAAALATAALSRPTVADVAAALGSEPGARAALAEAEDAGIVRLDAGRIRFTHPLVASAAYGSASAARRREIHRVLARVAHDPEERARHLAQSDASVDEQAAATIEEAAARAARRGAQEAAAELYRASRERTPPELAVERTRCAVGEATALLAAGDAAAAHRLAREAVSSAPAGSARAHARFLLAQTAWLEEPGAARSELEAALAEAEDDSLRGRIHSKLAALVVGDHATAVAHADAAAALLDEREEPGAVAYALVSSLFFGAQTGLGDRPELLDRALRLEERAGPDSERSSLFLIWLEALDRFDDARARHELEDRWYRERGEEGWQAEKLAHRAMIELRAGEWRLAEELIERSCVVLEQLGAVGPWAVPLAQRARVDAHVGRIERARATIGPIVADFEHTSAWFAALTLDAFGFVELAAANHAAAAEAYERAESHLESSGIVCPLPIRFDADHVEALVLLGEPERAQRVLERFESRAATFPRTWTAATLPRARALVAAAAGEPEAALELVETPPQVDELPFERARTLLERGRLQRRLKRRRQAAESLREALSLFERLGSPPWLERTRSELDRVGLRRAGDELTATERRIAELAARGLTNREIALTAFVSAKTVEANLARVYRKLGIHSRAELGARMGARGEGAAPQT